jgi:hypothetical protein
MKIKSLLLMAVLAVSSVATSVNAAVSTPTNYYFGDVTNISVSPVDAYLNSGLTTPYTGSYMYTAAGTDFIDIMNFSVNQLADGTGVVVEKQSNSKNITNMAVSLYAVGNPTAIATFSDLTPSGPSNFSGSGTLAVGSYQFVITGTSGSQGGQYAFYTSTQAVPEPETWAMLLCGIGLVGLQLRKRHAESGKISLD